MEASKGGIGVSVSARKYMRAYFPETAGVRNVDLNEMIAGDFASAEPVYRFKLRSGEIGEIRKSSKLYYVAAVRGRGTAGARYDILVLQPSYKPVEENLRKRRLEPGWGVE